MEIYGFWGDRMLEVQQKFGITEEKINFFDRIEKIFVVRGVIRTLWILCELREPQRYTLIEKFSMLPTSTFRKTLDHMFKHNLIKVEQKFFEEPRKQKVSVYSLSKEGYQLYSLIKMKGWIGGSQ